MTHIPLLVLLTITTLLTHPTKCEQRSSQSSLHDNSQSCNCYTLDSATDKSYFLYHRFYDFRSLAKTAGQYNQAPPLVQANQRYGKEQVPDPEVLNTTAWGEDWGIQDWGKASDADAPVAMQNSAANVFISKKLNTSHHDCPVLAISKKKH
jgi:hypothetical protein